MLNIVERFKAWVQAYGADKWVHFKGGVAIAAALVVLVLLAAWKPWLAVAVGGTGGCAFVEWYQRYRGNGKAEKLDLVFGALPSWVAGLALLFFS